MFHCKHQKAHKEIRETGIVIYRCDICKEELQSPKRRLINTWISYNFYVSRGEMYLSKIEGIFNSLGGIGVGFLLFQGYSGKLPSIWLLPLFYISRQALAFFIGWQDYKKLKLSQREQVFGIRYQPTTMEMFDRLKKIEKKVAPETYKDESVTNWYK